MLTAYLIGVLVSFLLIASIRWFSLQPGQSITLNDVITIVCLTIASWIGVTMVILVALFIAIGVLGYYTSKVNVYTKKNKEND